MTEKTYGDAFVAVCKDAGLWGLPFSVSTETVLFSEALSEEDRAAIEALMEAFTPPEGQSPGDGTPPVVTVVYKVDFYRRLTDEEAEQVEQTIAQQPVRQRRIFESANTFRSDVEEWATLEALAYGLFGPERAAVILAPSEVPV